jgi:hypothetical protein
MTAAKNAPHFPPHDSDDYSGIVGGEPRLSRLVWLPVGAVISAPFLLWLVVPFLFAWGLAVFMP